jgi:hypothetical protein
MLNVIALIAICLGAYNAIKWILIKIGFFGTLIAFVAWLYLAKMVFKL